jgi:hypothetical protein
LVLCRNGKDFESHEKQLKKMKKIDEMINWWKELKMLFEIIFDIFYYCALFCLLPLIILFLAIIFFIFFLKKEDFTDKICDFKQLTF